MKPTDDFGYNITENPVHVHDLQATILHLLGINHEQLTYRYAGQDAALHGRGQEGGVTAPFQPKVWAGRFRQTRACMPLRLISDHSVMLSMLNLAAWVLRNSVCQPVAA